MKISLEWLAEYVDLDGLEPAELADLLTVALDEAMTGRAEGFDNGEEFDRLSRQLLLPLAEAEALGELD